MGTVQCYDATHSNIASLPAGQVAGYVTGSSGIAWTSTDWNAHPGAVRIDQSPVNTALDETADVLDFERGAATLADIVPWALAALMSYHLGTRPGQRTPLIYASQSNLSEIANALVAGNLANGSIGFWIANWSDTQAVAEMLVNSASGPFPVRAVQYQDNGNYDTSVMDSAWLAAVSKSVTPPAVTYDGVLLSWVHGKETTPYAVSYVSSTDNKHWS